MFDKFVVAAVVVEEVGECLMIWKKMNTLHNFDVGGSRTDQQCNDL